MASQGLHPSLCAEGGSEFHCYACHHQGFHRSGIVPVEPYKAALSLPCPHVGNPSEKESLVWFCSQTLNTSSTLRFIIKTLNSSMWHTPLFHSSYRESGRGGIISWPLFLSGHLESGPIHGYFSLGGFLGSSCNRAPFRGEVAEGKGQGWLKWGTH